MSHLSDMDLNVAEELATVPSKLIKVSCGWERGVRNLVAMEIP